MQIYSSKNIVKTIFSASIINDTLRKNCDIIITIGLNKFSFLTSVKSSGGSTIGIGPLPEESTNNFEHAFV